MTPITLTNYDVGTLLALKGFAAAMLGGMGNPLGAVVGGLVVGLLEAFGAGYISSAYKDAIAFLVILARALRDAEGPVRPRRRRARLTMTKFLQRHGVVLAVAALVALLPLVLPSSFYFRIAALVFIFALAVLGLNLADGLRRAGEPRPCRLLRHRRLRGRGWPNPFRHSGLGGTSAGRSRLRVCSHF